jgi:hypothetical protein
MKPVQFVGAALILCRCMTALAGDAAWVAHNDRLTVTFDPAEHGAVVSLTARGTEFIARQRAPRLFQLVFSQRGDPKANRLVVTSREMAACRAAQSAIAGRTALRLTFSGPADRPIEVVCTVTAARDDPLLHWGIESRFPASLALESVQYPILGLRAPLGGGDSDAIVVGSTKGGIYRRPWSYPPGRSISCRQPGNLAAAFACYYNDDVGLLSAVLDPRGYRKSVDLVRTAAGVELAWQHPCLESSPYVSDDDAVLSSFARGASDRSVDWRDGADIYKRWAVSQPWCAKTFANRDDLPGWLKQGPAMVRFNRDWLARPERIERWLKQYWRPQFGDTPLIIAYWGWEKVGTWVTPDYFPCYPSDGQFRRLVKLGRELGGHAFLWPSGYHYTMTYDKRPDGRFAWDDRQRFDAVARPHAVCQRDGTMETRAASWLLGGECATMCAGDPWTIDWFNHTAVEIVRRGVELVQVDQVVGGGFPVCYSLHHGHPPGPGRWSTDAFRKQLETMLAACRKVDPDAVVCFEEPNEWFIQQVGIQDYRDFESLKQASEPASVFNYLYHEYLPTFQSNPKPDRLMQAYCLVNGEIPHFVPEMQIGPGPLLRNGGFEEVQRQLPEGWEKVKGYKGQVFSGAAACDAAERHAGRRSLRLHNTEDGQIVQVSQNIAVGGDFAAGRKYRLSAWMKSTGLQRRNAILLGALAPGLKSAGSWQIAMPRDAGGWVRGGVEFTLPPQSELLRIMLQLNGPGTVWLDDLALEEIRSDGTAATVRRPDKPVDHALMRQWVELFHGAGRPYLLLGKMVHPPRLQAATSEAFGRKVPAVWHNAFEAPDHTLAAVLVNVTDEPQSVELFWPEHAPAALTLQPWQVQLARP